MACDSTKVFGKQTAATLKVKEHVPYLSDPRPKKKVEVHRKTGKKAKVHV